MRHVQLTITLAILAALATTAPGVTKEWRPSEIALVR